MLKCIALSTTALAGVTAAIAETPPLSGEAIRAAVTGKTVVMNTPVGGIPVSYRDNGTMIGRAKDLQLYTGQERDRGKWWVKSDQMCQQWETWLEGQTHCFTVRIDGVTVFWRRNDGKAGTATIVTNAMHTQSH